MSSAAPSSRPRHPSRESWLARVLAGTLRRFAPLALLPERLVVGLVAAVAVTTPGAPGVAHAEATETQDSKPDSVDDSKPDSVDDGKPDSVDDSKPDSASDPGAETSPEELVAAITQKGPGEARLASARQLASLTSAEISAFATLLARKRTSSAAERRAVLTAIHADVPDKDGRFRPPRREKDRLQGEDADWLAALARLDPASTGLGEVMADVALIQGLAAHPAPAAAEALLDFAFTDDGALYRDECGRSLRRMSPYSLPTLIVVSAELERDRSMRRYASYQLDRLDRQDPNKALSNARDDHALELAVIRAYGESKHREAFQPLLSLVMHPVTDIREAARQSVMAYVTGPEPPPAPRRKLVLPGGKLSDREQPLWLNYRELAEIELRRQHEAVLGEPAPRKASPAELARKLFEHHDAARAAASARNHAEASELARAGKLEEAVAILDQILARDPDYPERARMAETYFALAEGQAKAGGWRAAAVAYSKAHDVAPDGALAGDAMASHHFALGKALEAAGKDGSAAFRLAESATPPGKGLSAAGNAGGTDRWMLYGGIGGGASALILLILALAVRRR